MDWRFESIDIIENRNKIYFIDIYHAFSEAKCLVEKYYNTDLINSDKEFDILAMSLFYSSLDMEMRYTDCRCESVYPAFTVTSSLEKVNDIDSDKISISLVNDIISHVDDLNCIIRIEIDLDKVILTIGPDYRIYRWTIYMELLTEEVSRGIFVSISGDRDYISLYDFCAREYICVNKALEDLYSIGSYSHFGDTLYINNSISIDDILAEAKKSVEV